MRPYLKNRLEGKKKKCFTRYIASYLYSQHAGGHSRKMACKFKANLNYIVGVPSQPRVQDEPLMSPCLEAPHHHLRDAKEKPCKKGPQSTHNAPKHLVSTTEGDCQHGGTLLCIKRHPSLLIHSTWHKKVR